MVETINKKDIEKFYDFLGHEKQSELRFIEPRWENENTKPIQEWANNLGQFIFLCEKYNGKMNLYVGINERIPKGDKDEDVKFITIIGHDIDAHDGNPDNFMKAQETALKIKDDCIKKGYNEPLVLCSGRGFWVIHKVSKIENTKDNRKRIKEFGKSIKKKYEVDGIELDSSVYNPSRIARIPGTINVSDKENQILSFIVNEPKIEDDLKLTEKIINLELPKMNYSSNGGTPKSSCAFMDYCLSHEIPSGQRHKVISRNMSIYISKHPDRELLKEQYFKVQKGSSTELDQWLKGIDSEPDKEFPFACGQLINFQKEYKIPLKCKGCPKFLEYKKEKKAKKKLLEEKQKEERAKRLNKKIISFYDKKDLANKFLDIQPLFYEDTKIWWLWDFENYKWMIVDEIDILNLISKSSEADTITSKERNEILEALKQISRNRKPLNMKKTWIQFKDKIIDIKTEKEFDASPKYFITNPIPFSVGISDETPIIDKIFEEWVGKDYVKTLKEIISYCLIPDYPIHRIFCFIGGGMNGKSCFLNLLRNFIGNYNCCSTELDTLITSRFEVTRLHKKLVCQMGETNFNEMSKTSILKKLSGGDLIGFEYKNKNPFEEINYAKIIIATNNLPTTTDKTIGFYRRWMIVDFPNQFSEKKDILEDIPEEEYECLALKCIGVLKDLLKLRQFHKEGSIEDRKTKYEDHSDPLEKFINEFTIEDISKFITKSEFHRKLNQWLNENRHRNMSDVVIAKNMKKKGIYGGKDYIDWFEGENQSRKQVRVWHGIKWRDESQRE